MSTENPDEIIDLEGFVRAHPAAMKSYMSLCTSLRASFPSEPRQVRLALAAYGCGIERKMSRRTA